jgi:hypothetical protein
MVTFMAAKGQMLRFRLNSVQNLHIVVVGQNQDGKKFSKTYYDLTHDTWKKISLNELMYGYDAFHNKEMIHDGYDTLSKWTAMLVYDKSNRLCGQLDLTNAVQHRSLENTSIWARIRQNWERDYLVTDVIINDD